MTHVATLVADPSVHPLAEAHLAAASAVLSSPSAPVWLAPDMAADIHFAPGDAPDNVCWTEMIRASLKDVPLDIVVQSSEGRRKRLLIADMDSTMIEQECIDELAEGVGLRDQISAITERSMRGEVSFEQSLLERVALLKGLDVDWARCVVTQRISPMPGAKTLVATMRAHGAFTAIASGGFTLFTAAVAQELGFDRHYSNTLGIENNLLTGTLCAPLFGRESKRETLRALCLELGLVAAETMAVGDGANDLAMLAEAGTGVAFRAKPAVAETARARIDHGDLTALLYLQGYRREDFVA